MTVTFARSRAADCISMKWKPAAPSPVPPTTPPPPLPTFPPPGPAHGGLEDGEIRARARRRPEPVRPERREAAVDDVDRLAAERLPDRLHDVRRVKAGSAPRLDHARLLRPPLVRGAAAAREEVRAPRARLERGREALERLLHVADDAD